MSRRRPGSRHHGALNWRRWARARRACFGRDGWRCTRCGRAGRLECHHVVALEAGGERYDLGNLETLCRSCHVDEHRRPVSDEERAWRELASSWAARGAESLYD